MVDLGGRRDADRPIVQIIDQRQVTRTSLARGELLGVVDPRGGASGVDDRGGGDDGTEKRTATRLIEPGDPATTGTPEFLLEGLYWSRFSLIRAALPRRVRR